ncbi:MAG: ABC transporter permease [Solirubrobacteraceae bacterium]|nr:ABC transporter permease [Solirubrobacteraceae bacterium]
MSRTEPRSVGWGRVRLIASREFRERVGQKAYLIALVVGALVAAAAVIAPSLLGGDDDGAVEPERVAIVVQDTPASARARLLSFESAAATLPGAPVKFVAKRDEAQVRASVRDDDEEVGAVVTGTTAEPEVQVVTREGGSELAARVIEIANRAAQEERLTDATREISKDQFFAPVKTQEATVEGSGPTVKTTAVVSVLGLLLYIAGIMLTTSYATGIVSDRTNHVTERLLTAAKPREHLAGKLLGIGASGLLQFAAWIAAALIADVAAGSGTALDDVPASLMIFFPVALVLTYVLYAAAATVLVLPVRKAEDVSGAIGPAVMLQVVGFIATTTIVAPGATISGTIQILSLIPFFSPLLMLARLAAGDVPAWELAVGVAGPIVLAIILLRLAGPAYARYSIDAPGGKGLKAALGALRTR